MFAPNVVSISSDMDIIAARIAARSMARSMGFTAIDQARIATATSELTRNIFVYAGEGEVVLRRIVRNNRHGIEIVFSDHGPGISNVEQVLEDGYSTAGSMGLGLPGARRLMDELEIETAVGSGTTITVRKWLPE